ncbi:MAG TPA: YIP1 family protein [Dehalococcoidia bacterium]|jgi:hypothetical protein|nr:YIP1 family protein [Dehalococcoidia bacterium]
MDPQVMVDRLTRLARLDTSVFEEMRDDASATIPAFIIVAASFLIAALGGWFWWLVQSFGDKGRAFFESVIGGTILATVMWAVWVAVAFLVLTSVFNYVGNVERCLRACGFAAVPAALMLFMFIPGINLAVGLAALALMFLLMDIGIQVSFDAQPGHVILATFAGFLAFVVVLSLATQKNDWFAPGVFLFRVPSSALGDVASAFSRVTLP